MEGGGEAQVDAKQMQRIDNAPGSQPVKEGNQEMNKEEKEQDKKKHEQNAYESQLEKNTKDEISEWKEKIEKLVKKHEEIQKEVQDKEDQLKELKEKESQDDQKTNKNESALGFGAGRKLRGPRKQDVSQFHMMHLLIAIIVGLGIGILCGKLLL
jgi:chromosome segregation ATPase